MRLDHLLSREQADPKGKASNRGRLPKNSKEGSGKRDSLETDKGRARKSVLRNNCRSRICIVFRIPKGSLKGEESPAHLDNCTEKKTRKVLKDQLQRKESQLTGKFVTSSQESNQAKKSTGWMPRHQAPKKDVASCEKSGGAASRLRSLNVRMGKPGK